MCVDLELVSPTLDIHGRKRCRVSTELNWPVKPLLTDLDRLIIGKWLQLDSVLGTLAHMGVVPPRLDPAVESVGDST